MKSFPWLANYFEKQLHAYAGTLGASPKELYEPLAYILSLGGKRIRPGLLLTSCTLFGGDLKKAIPPAIGVEVFHNFSLVHDDIMDKASLRRNKKTVHEKWDVNTAILSGDVMLVKSFQFFLKTDKKYQSELLELFVLTAIQVCEGQQLDMNFEKKAHVPIRSYLEMIRLKTAVLLGASLKMGAILAGAKKEEAEKIYKFGENTGIAFQLKDDLLDIFGLPEKFGKTQGGDILANKKTFLLLKALEVAKGTDLIELKSLMDSSPEKGAEKISRVKAIYEKLDIRKATEKKMDEYYRKGMTYLDKVNVSENKKTVLRSLADQLMMREN